MRLTTRLMQIASWLLMHRSVASGEMSAQEAAVQKCRIHAEPVSQSSPDLFEQLPEDLKRLIARSLRLQKRIRHIDRPETAPALIEDPSDNAVAKQQDRLRMAFSKSNA